MENNPKVTVLMPVYNGEAYLREAIESILNQTFTDFEFLIINDGSTDKSQEIIESYNDKRIRLINNETNLKLIETLNRGLKLAKGEYIARMDADDISLPERLKIQVDFMDRNKDIGVCGSYLKIFCNGKKSKIRKVYTQDEEIRCAFLFWGCIAHPCVMLRRKLFIYNKLTYSKEFIHAEDFELWSRCLKIFKFANIPIPLLMYRVNEKSVSNTNSTQQMESTIKATYINLRDFGIDFTEEEFEFHKIAAFYETLQYKDRHKLEKVEEWLNKLLYYNLNKKKFDPNVFLKIVAENWYLLCLSNLDLGLYTIKCFAKAKFLGMGFSQKLLLTNRFLSKSLVRMSKKLISQILGFLRIKDLIRRIK